MSFLGRIGVAIVSIVGLAFAGVAIAGDAVTIGQGTLHGATAGAVTSFKAIPYAAPPVGPLRWRPPQPPAPWQGVREASVVGPGCIQPRRYPVPLTEDCLTLNVWKPAAAAAGARLPVMVWIHGGSFVYGAGGSPAYDGTHYAERGVVMVTLNYRLGRLGFFAHPALTREGAGPVANYGLMDQIAALKWVKANIAAFGGDPAKVTVFGESAGAISVNYLLTSPMARGLFSQAIVESGFARQQPKALADAQAQGAKFAADLGVAGDDAAALTALRALPADKLSAAPDGVTDPTIPGPILDGKLIVEPVAAAFAAGHQARVPLIVGGNSWEASLLPKAARYPEVALARLGGNRDELVALYGGPADLAKVANDAVTDAAVIEPDRFEARAMARAGQPAYVYFFSYVPAADRASLPGARHGAEVLYVMGNLPTADGDLAGRHFTAATADDRKISEAMLAYWVAFARTGDPGQAGGPAWPRYDPRTDTVLEFGPDGVNARPAFRKARLDFIEAWSQRRAASANTAASAP
jgi:para-nitrobenzyl esterase